MHRTAGFKMGSDAECVTGCRAEDYETEESSRHVITYEEERAKLLVHLIFPPFS